MEDADIRREATELCQELIRIDTSNPPGGEAPAAMLLRDYLASFGIECELTGPDASRPNLVARIPGTGGGPSLAICGHTDVVPADAADWTHPPFAAHVDADGYLWGRGAADMKNETATRALTLAILAREGFRPRGDLVFIAQSDEEDGIAGVGMRWLVRNRADLRVDYAIDEGAGQRLELADGRVVVTIEVGQKATLPVRVTALGEAGHASVPHLHANAVPRVAQLVDRIARYRPRRRLVGATEQLLREALGAPVDDDLDAAVDRARALHPYLADAIPALVSTTMAPTRLAGSNALNVMPARASVDVDCRILPGTTAEALEAELREALGDDLPYELEWLDALIGGAASEIGSPLYAACQGFLDADDPGARLLPIVSTGFADSNYLREGWATIAHGFWPVRTTPRDVYEDGVHNRDERIHVDDLLYATRAHLHIVRSLLG